MAIFTNYPENMTPELKYDLMRSPAIKKMRDAVGQRLSLVAYLIREDTNSDGEIIRILSVKTKDGDMFATNSPVFLRDFEVIVDAVGKAAFDITVLDGVSRNGRHYCTCAWAHD